MARVLADRFELVRELGAGAMGTVYEALDRATGAVVALKTMNHDDSDTLARFKAEFRAVADLHHPNVVRLGELIEDGESMFFTMELVDGVDFLRWVRGPAPSIDEPTQPIARGAMFDEARLRDALRQLVDGLSALHDAHQVHRDIKPSNVFVTRDGRVVILDFGLATRTRGGLQRSDVMAAGTVAFMSPEQAASRPVGPRSDWYSVGVLLYEVLTGRLPFDGPAAAIVAAKQTEDPPPPDELSPELPRDLSQLCVDLLRRDPQARPRGPELRRRLASSRKAASPIGAARLGFVGRRAELDALGQAFQDSRRGAVVQLICAAPGAGKSALMEAFVEQIAPAGSATLLLSSRCHEREALAYQAFDGVVDQLTRFLLRLPASALERALPPSPGLLGLLFPTMLLVPRIAEARAALERSEDREETRRRAFERFRELVDRLSARAPLVIAIDDLDRANRDSLDSLTHLTRAPDAPRVLIVATARRGAVVDALASHPEVRVMELPPLAAGPAHELARLAMTRIEGGRPEHLAQLVGQAGGHPGWLLELVRSASAATGARTLDELLGARIARLSADERRLLGITAIAGQPETLASLERALALGFGPLLTLVEQLQQDDLVRLGGRRPDGVVEPYHARVTDLILADSTEEERRDWHARLATALAEADQPDRLLRHRVAAGLDDGVGALALEVARRAAAGYEPHRAIAHYLIARGRPDVDQRSLAIELADVYASVGQRVLAAGSYQAAAALADPITAAELRRRSADQLLLAGYIPEALELYAEILEDVGLPAPRPPPRGTVRLIWQRARARLSLARRGTARAPTELERARLAVLWSVSAGMSTIDTMRAAEYQARYVALALRVGTTSEVSRGIALGAVFSAARGQDGWQRAQALLVRAAAGADDEISRGWIHLARGMGALIAGEFALARTETALAEDLFAADVHAGLELRTARMFGIRACYYGGDLREMIRRVHGALYVAHAQDDRFTSTQLSLGNPNAIWLFAGEPDTARRRAEAAIAAWASPRFQVPNWFRILDEAQTLLYEGDAVRAHAAVCARWDAFRRSNLLRVAFIANDGWFLRGRTAIAAAASAPAERARHLEDARRAARRLRAGTLPWRLGLVGLLDAAVANLRGEREAAIAGLRAAADALAPMTVHAAAARYHLARLTGGDPAPEVAAVRAHGVVDPPRWFEVIAPGFGAA